LRVGVVYHERYLEHDLGFGHPERPERLKAILRLLEPHLDRPELVLLRPEAASEDDLLRVHSREYVGYVEELSRSGRGGLSIDTPAPRGVYETARLAAGGAILAGESVARGDVDRAFALVRPPGHHAGRNYGGGFCFFNNIAIMIEHLKAERGLEKFAILDWDVHHGNGTQDIFYEDPTVLYFSTHQYPLYPGTGRLHEVGRGDGAGYNVNVPLPPGSTGADFLYALRELFIPLVEEFKPDIICVSAGYDAYFRDPLASLRFSIGTYTEATRALVDLADGVCGGRVVVVLEGGYNLDAVSHGVLTTILTMAGLDGVEEPHPPPAQVVGDAVREEVDALKEILSQYWSTLR